MPSMPPMRLWALKWDGKYSAPKMSTNTGSRHRYVFSVARQGRGECHQELSSSSITGVWGGTFWGVDSSIKALLIALFEQRKHTNALANHQSR